MANIKSINGNPIVLDSTSINDAFVLHDTDAITLTTSAGYYDANNSAHIAGASSDKQEVVTSFFAINENIKAVSYDLRLPSVASLWIAVLVRYTDGAYVRTVLLANVSLSGTAGVFNIPEGAAALSFTYRSYGTAEFKAFPIIKAEDIGVSGLSPYPENIDDFKLLRSITVPSSGTAGRYDVIFNSVGLYYFDASDFSNGVMIRITDVKEIGVSVNSYDYDKFYYIEAGKVAPVLIEEEGRRSVIIQFNSDDGSSTLDIYFAGTNAALADERRMCHSNRKYGQLEVDFVHQGVINGLNEFGAETTRISTGVFKAAGQFTVSLSDYTYGRYAVKAFSDGGVQLYDSGWASQDKSWAFDGAAYFAVVLSKQTNAAVSVSEFDTFGLTITPDEFGYYEPLLKHDDIANISGNLNRSNIAVAPTRWKYYYDHLFIDKLNGNAVIPSESLFNVHTSRRLGFNMIEANVQPTSDGNYIVAHGANSANGMTFGQAFYHVDGDDISSTPISSVTLAWIKENVRYVSTHDKYKVAPPSLQEFLYECKQNGLTALIGRADDSNVISIADEIMGKGNYVAYDGLRELTSAPIMHASSLTTVEEIVSQCKMYGPPYMYCMSNPISFTDAQLAEIVAAVHDIGCWIGYTACYLNEGQNQRLRKLGFDFAASGWEIPEFEHGNICNLYADGDFSDFTHTGTVSDGVLTLDKNETLVPAQTLESQFLAGGSLHIVFEGVLLVYMGHKIGGNGFWADDGLRSIWISSYFVEAAPTFTVKGHTGGARIHSIQYKASRF